MAAKMPHSSARINREGGKEILRSN